MPRNAADIREPPVSTLTAGNRAAVLSGFEIWAAVRMERPFEELAAESLPMVTEVVRAAGWKAFEEQWTRNQYKDLLLAIGER